MQELFLGKEKVSVLERWPHLPAKRKFTRSLHLNQWGFPVGTSWNSIGLRMSKQWWVSCNVT